MDAINVRCSSCGASLPIAVEARTLACAHCGTQHLVRRHGGIASLEALHEALEKLHDGADRTAAELGLRRLRDELANLETERSANEAGDSVYVATVGYFAISAVLAAIGVVVALTFGAWLVAVVLACIGIMLGVRSSMLAQRCHTLQAHREREYRERRATIDAEMTRHRQLLERGASEPS